MTFQKAHTKRDPRVSTFNWVRKCKTPAAELEKIVEHLERETDGSRNHSSLNISASDKKHIEKTEPINIVCFDGGGFKSYSHIVMMVELMKRCDNGEDLMSYFDLAAGTSAGGIAALMMNLYDGDTYKVIKEGALFLDKMRKKINVKWLKLLRKGSIDDQIVPISKNYFHDAPLYNPACMKAFALSTLRVEKAEKDKCRSDDDPLFAASEFRPFLMRTYGMDNEALEDHEDDFGNESSGNAPQKLVLPGTCDVKLWEAVVATSAAPVIFDRAKLLIDGQNHRFGDGWAISIAPVAIAINEARSLWPDRPIGVVLSFGLDSTDDEMNNRAIEASRKIDPNLHYLRLLTPNPKFNQLERNKRKIEKYKELVRSYIRDEKVQEVDEMIEVLRSSSKPRERSGSTQSSLLNEKPKRLSAQITNFFRSSNSTKNETQKLIQRLSILAAQSQSMSRLNDVSVEN